MADAGWYPDPRDPHAQHFFDGQAWTGQRRPAIPQTNVWLAPPPAPTRRRKRAPLVIATIAVAAVVAGLVTWLAWPDDQPSLTYKGKEIAAPSDVLKKAETNVDALVVKRHGAKNKQTRCYFAQPGKPAPDARKTDIEGSLQCGPVLFVDGNRDSTYLAVPLTSKGSAGGKATLDPQSSIDGIAPAAPDEGLELVRPDGTKAPDGNGGLEVPAPPGAEKNLLAATSLGATTPPPALHQASIVGKDAEVILRAAGEITRYGTGDDARSAPAGQKFVAFRLTYGTGDLHGTGSARAVVVVDGGAPRSVPATPGSEDWVVLGLPTAGQAVLQLTDAGFTQTLSLPGGKPGSRNIAVLARAHRTALVSAKPSVPIHLSNGNGSANATFRATATFAALDFWVPLHESSHPSSPTRAILSIRLTYTDSGSPGKTYGFDPGLVRLRLAGGQLVRAKNIAARGKIDDVFEVPATYTSGTLEITGAVKVGGVTVRVTKTKSFTVSIPAG